MKINSFEARHRASLTYLLLLLVFISASISGCTFPQAYHTVTPDGKCNDEDDCRRYYRKYAGYDLAFAEYTDFGNAYDNKRINRIIKKIEEHAYGEGVVLVTFIHGWNHNADEDDSHFKEFHELLKKVSSNGELLAGRRLVGLYIGWRGQSLSLFPFKYLSFWDRESAAKSVGKGVSKLLVKLDSELDIANKRRTTKNASITFAHSFGALMAVEAMAEVLTEEVESTTSEMNGIGDAVFLLNPAVEANRILHLFESVLSNKNLKTQYNLPLLVSISTDSDWATHSTFWLGKLFSQFIFWNPEELPRGYSTNNISEYELSRTALGNFEPFLTHRLTLLPNNDNSNIRIEFRKPCCNCEERKDSQVHSYWEDPRRGSYWECRDTYPLYFIKTDENIMTGHNDIFNDSFVTFLLAILNDALYIRNSQRWSSFGQKSSDSRTSKGCSLEEVSLLASLRLAKGEEQFQKCFDERIKMTKEELNRKARADD